LKIAHENKTLNAYLIGNFSHLQSKEKLQNTLYFQGKKILVLDSLGVYPKNSNPDIVVLTQSPKINLERLFQNLKPKMVVADGSNYRTYISLWEATCLKNKIPFHATGEKGFYRL
jgi:competence protein ComEC